VREIGIKRLKGKDDRWRQQLNENESLFPNEEDEYEYAGYAGCTQYLGKPGITRKCVLGIAAILVSTFQPEKITMISLRQRGQKSDGVMFGTGFKNLISRLYQMVLERIAVRGEVVSAPFWPLFGIIKSL
jgi:hypothetical protein